MPIMFNAEVWFMSQCGMFRPPNVAEGCKSKKVTRVAGIITKKRLIGVLSRKMQPVTSSLESFLFGQNFDPAGPRQQKIT